MEPEIKIAQRDGQNLTCPKCKDEVLLIALKDGQEVDYCDRCKGVWVDYLEEKDLLAMKPEVFTLDELRRLRRLYQGYGKPDPVKYAPCPICKELMHRKNWGSYSGVIVDRCPKHGTWYDEGELAKIREFIQAGGVEYEKAQKSEDGVNAVDRRLTNEAGRLDIRINNAYARARLYSLFGF